jgi:hypothetical protein
MKPLSFDLNMKQMALACNEDCKRGCQVVNLDFLKKTQKNKKKSLRKYRDI